MRRVLAVRQHQDLCLWNPRPNRLNLRGRTVLVFLALNAQHRTANGIEIRLDVPRAKTRIEPDIVPSPERLIHVFVITPQPTSQVRSLVANLRFANAANA